MELYNFFTEILYEEKLIEELHYCIIELIPICNNVQLVYHRSSVLSKPGYSIIGQIYGDDTNVGDLQLLTIFHIIKFTWFDATCPSINNIKE